MTLSLDAVGQWVKREANFFRIHLLFFLLVPLVSAGIFFAANGAYPVGKLHRVCSETGHAVDGRGREA